MRQGQQNRRGRGRNRKSQNPLTRSFESNGPDIKIRGTPSHVAEKYMSLARDAMTNDPVLAENYLQHAEHYNRIILTVREQQLQPNGDPANPGRPDPEAEAMDAQADEEDAKYQVADDGLSQGDQDQPPPQQYRSNPGNNAGRGDQQRGNGRQQRRGRNQPNGNGPSTGGNESRSRAPAPQASQPDGNNAGNSTAAATGTGPSNGNGHGNSSSAGTSNSESRPRRPRAEPTFADTDEQPEFLRRPVRRTRRSTSEAGDQPKSEAVSEDNAD